MLLILVAALCAQSAPTVTAMSPAPGSTQAAPGVVTVTLSVNIDPSSVSASTVTLVGRGPDGTFGTADDVTITPASIVVMSNVVTLNLSGQTLTDDTYRLRLSGSLLTPSTFSNLFGYWKLDEGGGLSTADTSGNGRNGTLNGPTWTAGVFGNGLAFTPGVNKVDIDAGIVAPPWTACMWVNRIDSSGIESCLMDSTSGLFTATSLRLEQFNPLNRTGITDYNVGDYAFNYIAPENTWIHLTFVGNSLSSTELYINGASTASLTNGINLFVHKLGGDKASSFRGALDEVQVYTRALGVSEIVAVAGLGNCIRSTSGGMLDGEFAAAWPSGNGVPGGDFEATFTVGGGAGSAAFGSLIVEGCGLGVETFFLVALLIVRRRRT